METSFQGTSTQDTINKFFQAVGSLDPDLASFVFAEHVDFYIAESKLMPWTGKRTTRFEVSQALKLLFAAHVDGEERFDLDHIFIDGSQAAVFGLAGRLVKSTGKRFTARFCMRFTVENELITRFLMLEDSREIEKAFLQT